MCAYSLKKAAGYLAYGKQDDGEWGGSHRILEVVKDNKVANTVVFVVREFGGQEIGPKRFVHIKECAQKVLKKMNVT